MCLDEVEPPLGFGEIQALSLKGWKGNRSDPKFVAVASAVRNQVSGERIARPHTNSGEPKISRRVAIAGGVGAVALAGTGGRLLLKPTAANANRIAVLSFANMSGDPAQAYFSDGIAEELRGALSRIGMQVIGKASSDAVKDLDTPAAEEGREGKAGAGMTNTTLFGIACIAAGISTIIYAQTKGRLFYPWSRRVYTSHHFLFWLCMVGAAGSIILGLLALMLSTGFFMHGD